jgi:kinesin family protein 18/19
MPPGTKRYKDKRFMFDKVFNHEARQDDVYQATSQPLLKGLFDGYNATVFAYGVSPRLFFNMRQCAQCLWGGNGMR